MAEGGVNLPAVKAVVVKRGMMAREDTVACMVFAATVKGALVLKR